MNSTAQNIHHEKKINLCNYSSEDINDFVNYITEILPVDKDVPEDVEKQNWLLENLLRMPFEENYQPSQYISTELSDPNYPYFQGQDRINAYWVYCVYGDDW